MILLCFIKNSFHVVFPLVFRPYFNKIYFATKYINDISTFFFLLLFTSHSLHDEIWYLFFPHVSSLHTFIKHFLNIIYLFLNSGLVVQGSNGEYVYLSTEERIDLVKCVRDSLPRDSGKIILAGSGCECKFVVFRCMCLIFISC